MRCFIKVFLLIFLFSILSMSVYGDKVEYNIVKIESVHTLENFTLLCDLGGWVSLEIPENQKSVILNFLKDSWKFERNGPGSWNLTPIKKGENTLKIFWGTRVFLLKVDSRDWGNNCGTLVFQESLLKDSTMTWGERLEFLDSMGKRVAPEVDVRRGKFLKRKGPKVLLKNGDREFLFSLSGGYQGGGGKSSLNLKGEGVGAFKSSKGIFFQGAGLVDSSKLLKSYGLSVGLGFEPHKLGGFIFVDTLLTSAENQKTVFAAQFRPGLRFVSSKFRGHIYGGFPVSSDQFTGREILKDEVVFKVYNRAILHGGGGFELQLSDNFQIGGDFKFAKKAFNHFAITGEFGLKDNLLLNVKLSRTSYGKYFISRESINRLMGFSFGVSHFSGGNRKRIKDRGLIFKPSYPIVVSLYKEHEEAFQELKVEILAAPKEGKAPLKVIFTSSVTGGKGPYTYYWSFSDPYETEDVGGGNLQRVYNKQGDYWGFLKVEDSLGNSSVSNTINISVSGEDLPHYTIKGSAGEGGRVTPSGDIGVAKGQNCSFRFSENEGYEIDGIFVDGERIGRFRDYTFENVQNNHTIHGTFRKKSDGEPEYFIEASSSNGGTIVPEGEIKVSAGANQIFSFKANEGFMKSSLFLDGKVVDCRDSFELKDTRNNHKLHVDFIKVEGSSYFIEASSEGGGSINPSGKVEVKEGDNLTFTFNPSEGNILDKVVVDGVDSGKMESYCFKNIKGNHSIKAVFEKESFVVNARAGVGGTISPSGSLKVDYGGSLQFSIKPDEGYEIDCLKVDGVVKGALNSYLLQNICEAHTLEAVFKLKTYKVEVNSHNGGKTDPGGVNWAKHGTMFAVRAIPEEGFKVKSIRLNGAYVNFSGDSYSFKVERDTVVDLFFESKSFNLKLYVLWSYNGSTVLNKVFLDDVTAHSSGTTIDLGRYRTPPGFNSQTWGKIYQAYIAYNSGGIQSFFISGLKIHVNDLKDGGDVFVFLTEK